MTNPPAPTPLSWPHCGYGADPGIDPVGCRGIQVAGYTACLAHLTNADRNVYLAGLTPDTDVDHRGTPFTEALLSALLSAFRDPASERPGVSVGSALFDGAKFSGAAQFDGARFSGDASFVGAQFFGYAGFEEVEFSGEASFVAAQFSDYAAFGSAQFSSAARFDQAHFAEVEFGRAQFFSRARFDDTQFTGVVKFLEVQFSSDVLFIDAQFSRDADFDRAQFAGIADFERAKFSSFAGFDGTSFANDARYVEAQFLDDVSYVGALFSGDARFSEVQFSGVAWYPRAQFIGDARYTGAQFSGGARFDEAQFTGEARFVRAQFTGPALFSMTQFTGDARFDRVRFTDAWFDGAQFSSLAGFDSAKFTGNARLRKVLFSSDALFDDAQFTGIAGFELTRFNEAWFDRTQFSSDVGFDGAQFSGDARFEGAQFTGPAGFARVQFTGSSRFAGAQFTSDVKFASARFAASVELGPLACAEVVDLSAAMFEVPVTLEIAAREVHCKRTRWESTAILRLRYTEADLSHAVLSAPLAVTAHPTPFAVGTGSLDESVLAGTADVVQVLSVRGVDAAHLVLTDTDLSNCLFSGAFHLDQLRLEGRIIFAPTPTGWHRRGIWPAHWTRRRTLAEEQHWRAQTTGQRTPPLGSTGSPGQWRPGPNHPNPDLTPDPEDVTALYRQLRKAFEDGKNEPGAADFYYGECEMRRHDRTGTSKGERRLLWGYWLLSGYGLRASRALGWLAAAMLVTILSLMGPGLPQDSPKQEATGVVPQGGGKVTFEIDEDDPKNPTGNRFTGERFEKALNVTLNSVVFRSSDQDLTTAGTYIEMASRLLEPTLLALAALAIRGRIKR